MPEAFTISTPSGPRSIGPGHPVLIVAELSGNHDGSFERAVQIVDRAAEAGADAIKLQTYTADTLTIDSNKPCFRVDVGNEDWDGQTLYQLYSRAFTPWEWQPKLKRHAEERGLAVFSTPFDASAVEFLERMEVPLYKVASFEIGDIPLLRAIGATRKPVILSRGLASVEEIARAVETLRRAGASAVAVLQCVSSYPAEPDQMNLKTIPDIARRFDVVPGLSDHSLGTAVAVASVALGACIIEKHVTLSRADGGSDAAFSLEPPELGQLVRDVRTTESALGRPTYEIGAREAGNRTFRRSIFVVEPVRAGEPFTPDNVRVIRPGHGLEPRFYDRVLGRRATADVDRGEPLSAELVEGFEVDGPE